MFEEASAMFRAIGEDFERSLRFHIEYGFVFAEPGLLLIGRPVAIYGPHDDAWWVEYASGPIFNVIERMPFWLPYVAYKRKGRMKVYATATMVNRIFKDGRTDTSVGWWGSWQNETTTATAIADDRSRERREGSHS